MFVLLMYCVAVVFVYLLCVSKVRVAIQKKLTQSQLSSAGWREKELKKFPDGNFSLREEINLKIDREMKKMN